MPPAGARSSEGGSTGCRLGPVRLATPRCGSLRATVAELLLTFADFGDASSGLIAEFFLPPCRLSRAPSVR